MLDLFLNTIPTMPDQPYANGLVAWWNPLQSAEWSDGKARNLVNSNANYDGTLQGATWSGNAPVNRWKSWKFVRASSQYVSLPVTLTAAPITLTGWFWSNDTTNSQELLSVTNTGATGEGFRLNVNGSARTVRAITTSGGTSRISTTSNTWTANKWHFAAAVFASTTSRFAYLDGVQATEETTVSVPSGVNGTSIGRLEFSSVINYFSGFATDLRIYNLAVPASGIMDLFLYGLEGNRRSYSYMNRQVGVAAAAAATQSWVVGGGVGGPSSVIGA